MSNIINISNCDNQLVIFAYNDGVSYELCNVQSGNFNSVDINLQIEEGDYAGGINANGVNAPLSENSTVKIPTGTYTLVYVGLNWGGPYSFEFNFNSKNYKLENNPQKPLEGVVWALGNDSISFNV